MASPPGPAAGGTANNECFVRNDGLQEGFSTLSIESRIGTTDLVIWRGEALVWWRVTARMDRYVVKGYIVSFI